MEFKYLLELLRAGLHDEFFAGLKTALPAFMDPEIYGRSVLENSSFIVSSAHPDPALHGNGFVARLSGATAEFLSLWVRMTAGPQPFRLMGDSLVLDLRPALPGWLFTGGRHLLVPLPGGAAMSPITIRSGETPLPRDVSQGRSCRGGERSRLEGGPFRPLPHGGRENRVARRISLSMA